MPLRLRNNKIAHMNNRWAYSSCKEVIYVGIYARLAYRNVISQDFHMEIRNLPESRKEKDYYKFVKN